MWEALPAYCLLVFVTAAADDTGTEARPPGQPQGVGRAEAWAIIDRGIKAQGGEAKLGTLRVMSMKLRARVIGPDQNPLPFTLDITWQLPGQYKSVMQFLADGKPMKRTMVVNGDQHWLSLNNTVRDMTAQELAEAREQMYAEEVCKLLPLRQTDYELTALSETKIEGRPAVGVNVARPGRRDVNLYFDKATGLLIKMEHVIKDQVGNEVSQEVVFRDYRVTGGVKHWGRVAVYNDHAAVFEADVAEVRFLERIDERILARPASSGTEKSKPK